MDLQLLHPDRVEYPAAPDPALQKAGYTYIGVVQLDGSDEWVPLAIVERGRVRELAAIDGNKIVTLDLEVAGPVFYDALDAACEELWQHNWNSMLGSLFGLNRRTLQRDRVSRYLLPARVVETLVYILSADDAAELSLLLQAIAAYEAKFGNRKIVENYVAGGLKLFYDKSGPGSGFQSR